MEILSMKRDVKHWFLKTWMQTHASKIPIEIYHAIEAAFKDFPSMREHLTPYPDAGRAHSQLTRSWSPAKKDLVDLMEDLICDVTYDGRYKDAIRGGYEAADFCDYESVQKRLRPIQEALGEEAAASAAKATAASADVVAASAVGGASESSAAPAAAAAAASASGGIPPPADSADPFNVMEERDRIRWSKYIAKQVDTYVDLIVDAGSVAELQLAIKDSKLATIHGDPTGLVLLHFDSKQFGAKTGWVRGWVRGRGGYGLNAVTGAGWHIESEVRRIFATPRIQDRAFAGRPLHQARPGCSERAGREVGLFHR